MTRVLNFGASISSGFWDPEGGWFYYLARDLHRETLEGEADYQAYNLGVSGHQSRQLLDRIGNEIEARNREGEDLIILISIGGNDSLYLHDREKNKVPLEEYRKNLEEILEIAKNYSDKPVFIGDKPVDYSVLDPLPWNENESVKRKYRERYMETARNTCERKEVPFVSISEKVEREEYLEQLVDGLHPDTEGHKKVYRIVKNSLKEEGFIE